MVIQKPTGKIGLHQYSELDTIMIFRRDSLNTGEHEHDELPKSIIVTNVDLSVFDNVDIKVMNVR